MIKYTLRCAAGHGFESWFASGAAYDALEGAGRLSCAVCGGGGVEKAPRLGAGTPGAAPPVDAVAETEPGAGREPGTLSRPATPSEAALAELRRQIESRTEDVGRRFAAEARAIHEGRAPDRAIRGQAKGAEARALLEEGVPILPLPFPPPRQVN